jgi:two-component system sensor histidine kinase/response regulator
MSADPTTEDPQRTARRRPRLLVAEDNLVNQKVALAMLERLGYATDLALNGVEAVDRVSRNNYAAVLMDCQMPEMDGYEATIAIREREQAHALDRTPIVAMTAAAMEGDKQRCIAAGMDDYLSKPVKLSELHSVLQRWIAKSPVSDHRVLEGQVGGEPVHLDPARVAELRELTDKSNQDGFSVIASAFLEDGPERLAALEQALANHDAKTVRWEAHALKGAAANVGATTLSSMCQEMEFAADEANLRNAQSLVTELRAEFQRVQEAMVAEVADY